MAQETSRFEILGRLGQGGMGVVYRALDRERGREVALKTLATTDADSIYRLKREFRSLAELSHPNLCLLHELFFENGTWFFTMELVKGSSFTSYVRRQDAASEEEPTRLPAPGNGGDDSTERPVHTQVYGLRAQASGPPAPPSIATLTASQLAQSGAGTDTLRYGVVSPFRAAPAGDGGATPAGPRLDLPRLTSALTQLVRGVHYLHQHGKQHRDLKPANVMVAEDGRVVLLDFGLALEKQEGLHGDDLKDDSSGTPAYMAPERHAGQPSTEASDWYSVGVMLFEALTGRRPYASPAALKGPPTPPPSPADLDPDLPAHLVDLCLRLLEWEPSRRPSGEEILRALGDTAGPASAAGSSAAAPLFVGREQHLQALHDAFDLLHRQGPILVKVQGTSGFGKTALVRHFLGQLRERHQAVVLAGRCYERESVPYKVFDSLIDALSRHLNTLPPADAASLMPRDVHVLARLFPSLMRAPAVVNAPRPGLESRDAHELSRRASAALKELLGRIARRAPLVMFVDDLHWGDLDSARLLGDLVVPPDPPRALLIASYRSEELSSNQVLRTLLESAESDGAGVVVREVTVGPMSAGESRQLAEKVLGTAAASSAIVKEAAGSPFFVTELARYVAGTPHLAGAGASLDVTLNDVLWARMDRLPENARHLLHAVAVAGRPLPQQLAVQSAGLTEGGDEAVSALRAASLVRLSGPRLTDTVEVYHDRIRETAVLALSPEKLAAQHRALAVALEKVDPPDAEALATHWQGAGEPIRAGRYALAAAARAAEALAFDRAARLYTLALHLLPPTEPSWHDGQVQLAHALKNAGRGADSARAYLEAGAGARSERERLELKRLAMEQFLVSGYVPEGRAVAQDVLHAVGLKMPATPGRVVLSLLQQRARVRLRGLRFHERDEAQVPPGLLDRIDTCAAMSSGLSVIDTKMGSDFSARFLRLALDGGEIGRVARGMVMEAAHQCTGGNFKRAGKLVTLAEGLAARSSSDHVKGFVQLMTGWTEYFAGHY
ncbi:MAG TPA: protein kinase, partial [Myxococcales bacterium]|nr:protein kinase [Myxococcales bacterium]